MNDFSNFLGVSDLKGSEEEHSLEVLDVLLPKEDKTMGTAKVRTQGLRENSVFWVVLKPEDAMEWRRRREIAYDCLMSLRVNVLLEKALCLDGKTPKVRVNTRTFGHEEI